MSTLQRDYSFLGSPRNGFSTLSATTQSPYIMTTPRGGNGQVVTKARRENSYTLSLQRSKSLSSKPKSLGGSIRSLNSTFDRSDPSVSGDKTRAATYQDIKEKALARRVLFEDPDFPADERSLNVRFKSIGDDIEWKRPHEISRRAKFIATTPGTADVVPAFRTHSCLVPAFSCLTLAPSLIQRCIPEEQEFDDMYAGVFRFRFWRFGEWKEILIDDRLPVHKGQLLFSRNIDPNEFWAALFEKAYAKLYGCYSAILGTGINWTLQDITGGIPDGFIFKDNAPLMQKVVDLAMTRASLISATIMGHGPVPLKLKNGLVTRQAYSVTGYAEIPYQGSTTVLVRLRNPWGTADWSGAWSEGSDMWNSVDGNLQKKLSHGDLSNREFWMPFHEFAGLFTHLELCHLTAEGWTSEPRLKHRLPWRSIEARRYWRRGYNAGGGVDSPLINVNTQFYLELKQQSHVILSLVQKYRQDVNNQFLPCECLIYLAPQGRTTRLQMNNFMRTRFIASTGLRADRNNVRFFSLHAGSYVIVPVTSQMGMEGKFNLRILTDDHDTVVRELDDSDSATFPQDDNHLDDKVADDLDTTTLYALRKRFLLHCNRHDDIEGLGLKAILAFKEPSKKLDILCCEGEKEEIKIRRIFLSLETCKAAITIVDKDMNGLIGYDEFMTLIKKLSLWQGIFVKFAIGNGSVMDTYALRNALRMAGFSVSNRTLEALVLRLAAKEYMNLEGFINAVVKLHVAHQQHMKATNGKMTEDEEQKRNLRELLQTAIYS